MTFRAIGGKLVRLAGRYSSIPASSAPPAAFSITAVNLSSASLPSGAAAGAVVGTLSVASSDGAPRTAAYALNANADFALSDARLTLLTANLGPGSYTVGGTASVAGADNSPRAWTKAITVLPPPGAGLSDIAMALRPAYAQSEALPHKVIGNAQAVGATGAVTFALSDPSGRFEISFNQVRLAADNPPAGSYPLTLTATDAGSGASISKTFTATVLAGRGIYLNDDTFSDAQSSHDVIGMSASLIPRGGAWTVSAGAFAVESDYQYIYYKNYVPAALGDYPVTITATGADGTTLSGDFTLHVIHEPPMTSIDFAPGLVSTADGAGKALGTARAFNRRGVYAWSLLDNDGGLFAIGAGSGTVTLAQDEPSLGDHAITIQVANGASTYSQTFTIDVAQGTILPPENMTLAVAQGIDNFMMSPPIGTPQVAGMDAPVAWSLQNEGSGEQFTEYFGADISIFAIDPDSGAIRAVKQVPARTHDIIVTASNGLQRCTRTFQVTSVWKQGPSVYVGEGMAAAHPGFGYEHWREFVEQVSPASGVLPPELAGCVVNFAHNADPDYFASDNGNGEDGGPFQYNVRFGIAGPITLQALDPSGPRPRLGGYVGSARGGVDPSGKGFLTFSNGDAIVRGLEVSFVQGDGQPVPGDNSHGVSGIRKNAQAWGDFTVEDCFIHDCNNDIETGQAPGNTYIRRNILGNAGTAYVNSGATHNLYNGANAYMEFTDNLTHRTVNGHSLKTRALRALIAGNRMYDGEHGSSSAVVDIPQGGTYVIRGNVIHKGPNAQNSGALQLIADEDQSRIHRFEITGNTFSVQVPAHNHFGAASAIKHTRTLGGDGQSSQVLAHDNSFYLAGDAVVLEEPALHDGHPVSGTVSAVVSNSTMLAAPPALDVGDPGTANPPAGRLGFYNAVQEQIPGNNYEHFYMVQIDAGADDLRIPADSAVGTVAARCAAYGANLWANVSPADPRINPFTAGSAWSLSRDPNFFPGDPGWAPDGRYAIDAQGVVTVAGPLVPGTDFIKVRCTAPDGTIADWRFYVSVF